MGLALSSPEPAGEHESLSRMAGGLLDPPGPEAGHSRVEKNERRLAVDTATAMIVNL